MDPLIGSVDEVYHLMLWYSFTKHFLRSAHDGGKLSADADYPPR